MGDMQKPALARGRLAHTLASRHAGTGHGGAGTHAEPQLRIEHRQGWPRQLEHLIICQYLYAAFSLKRDAPSEGLPEELVPTSVAGRARCSASPSRRCSTWRSSRTC